MRFILFTLLFMPLMALAAVEPVMRFERLSIEQGLSQSVGLSIGQDSEGFMWFGTYDGLNRYDGYQFKLFGHLPEQEDSLSSNTITFIYQDSLGILWIGTEGGLNRYNRDTQRFVRYTHDIQDSNSLSHNAVSGIAEDADGRLWVATLGGGVNRFDPTTDRFIHYKHQQDKPQSLSHDNVNVLFKDNQGRLWLGTDNGLNRYDAHSDGFSVITSGDRQPLGLSHNKVQDIYQDDKGDLWIGTFGGGLNRYDVDGNHFTHYRASEAEPNSLINDFIWSISQDPQGLLWIGTEGGLSKLEPDTGRFISFTNQIADPHSLSSDVIRDVFRDKRGLMWLGTFGGGINRVDVRQRQFGHYKHVASKPNSLSHNIVFALHQDNDKNLWVGTFGGGLNRIDGEKGTIEHFMQQSDNPDSLGDNFVWTIHEDSDGILWLGTRNGAYRFDKTSRKFTPVNYAQTAVANQIPDSVTAIVKDQRGELWFGTWGQGLIRYNEQTGEYQRYNYDAKDEQSISHDLILAMTEDDQGRIWIGTNNGVTLYQPDQDSFVRIGHKEHDPSSLTPGFVTSIYQDDNRDIWVGTSAGLNKWLPKSGGFIHFSQSDGLPNDVIYCIAEDAAGLLWVSTNRGLSAFNRQLGSFKNYDTSFGLQSNEFNHNACMTGPEGEIFFGGVNGFNRFFPDKITLVKQPPEMVFTNFLVANEAVDISAQPDLDDRTFYLDKAISQLERLDIGYRQNLVSFEFSALDYHSPLKNQYQYKLEGYDEKWLTADPKIRLATYTNLPSGIYTLRVKGSNSDGFWNEKGVSIDLHVSPPPWMSWWALTMYLFSFVLTIAYVAYFLGQRKNERRVIEQLKEVDKLKDDFLAKMSHEIRTPTNAVVGLSRLALNAKTEQERREHISTVLESGDSLLELINDILDFSKINAAQMTIEQVPLDLGEVLTQTINQSALRAHEQGLSLAVVTESEIPMGLIGDPLRVRQVLVNLVNNAVKFTDTGGVWIGVDFKTEEDGRFMLQCSVNDTGCGMDKTQQAKLFKSYVQADTSVSRTHGGTGLGLAIAKQLCELMGGQIWLESEPGKGSSFYFTVELQQSDEVQSTEVPFSGFRALVLDEVDFCNTAVVSQLKTYGVQAQGVTDISSALRAVKAAEVAQTPFNLLLADWRTDGLDRVLHALDTSQYDTMVMFMVGRYEKENFRKRFAEAAKLNIIDKPVLPHELNSGIRQMLAGEALADTRLGPTSLNVPDLSAYRILLVEDNAINRQVALGFLDYTGAKVEVAENGQVALGMLKRKGWDLVLMDIDMPKMDGLTATKTLRSTMGLSHLPVIAITGYATPGDAKRFADAGMVGHITKPFEQQSLYQAIGAHLEHKTIKVAMGPAIVPQDKDDTVDIPDFTAKLEKIAGLDVQKAVSRLSGHEGLYYELIKRFQRHERTLLARIEATYQQKDWQELARATHSLKSMAAFIGADRVSGLAATLEDKLAQDDFDDTLYQLMCDELKKLLDGVDKVLSDRPKRRQSVFEMGLFIEQLHQLLELLKSTDFDAEALLERMRDDCYGTAYQPDIDAMIELLDEVEFEQALHRADSLLQRCRDDAETEKES